MIVCGNRYRGATTCRWIRYVAVCCSVLQCIYKINMQIMVCGIDIGVQRFAGGLGMLQFIAVCCSV